VGDTLRTKIGYYYENKQEIDFVVVIKNETHLVELKFVDNLEEVNFEPLISALKSIKPTSITYVT